MVLVTRGQHKTISKFGYGVIAFVRNTKSGEKMNFTQVISFVKVCETNSFHSAAKVLYMTQSAVSHQLRILKQSKLVKSRRDGKSIFYSLADGHVKTIIDQGREHIEED